MKDGLDFLSQLVQYFYRYRTDILQTFCSTLMVFFFRVEREKAQASDPSKVSVQKTAEEVKAQLESQLKQQRLAAQQVGKKTSMTTKLSIEN